MRYLIMASAVLVAGCAATPASLTNKPAEMTFESKRSAQSFAACVADNLQGMNDLRNDSPDHYWVNRKNGWGGTASRWDFVTTPTGSRAERRSALAVNTGSTVVQRCAISG